MFNSKKILFICFKENSSSTLIENLINKSNIKKLFLENDFGKCKEQLLNLLIKEQFDYIFAFGWKPNIKQLFIEYQATDDELKNKLNTNFNNVDNFLNHLQLSNIKYRKSENAGNYLCNFIYYQGLKYIKENGRDDKMLFIHIPNIKNFVQYENFKKFLNDLIK